MTNWHQKPRHCKAAPAASRKGAPEGAITVTRITSIRPSTLTKTIDWDGQKLHTSTVAGMVEGHAETVPVHGPAEFAKMLANLDHSQALCYGATGRDDARIYSKHALAAQQTRARERGGTCEAIARTKDYFAWPSGAGILMLDYDPRDGEHPLSRDELLAAIRSVIPGLDATAYVCWYSSSSMIYRGEEQLAGIRGQRIYLLVQDAQDIERAGAILFQRLWLAGHGYYAISRSGAALERSLIDAAVWQPNRLDFAAGAQCEPPLEQRRGDPEIHDGQFLDTKAALPDLTPEETAELRDIKSRAKASIEDQIQAAKTVYIEETARKLIEQNGGNPESHEQMSRARAVVARATEQRVLSGNFVVTLSDGVQVTVAELLDAPQNYHGRTTLDPLEPEYRDNHVCGKLYLLDGCPNLYSFAHGGRTFRLIRQPKRIELRRGRTREATDAVLAHMRGLPDVFDMGSQLVHVQDGRVHVLGKDDLGYWLAGVTQFCQRRNEGEVDSDPPEKVLKQILAIERKRGLRPLKALITAPVIDTDGRILDRVGYDPESQLYLDMPGNPLPIPENVTRAQLQGAVETLMGPFSEFSISDWGAKSVLLAAILTAIQRPILSTAPAIGLDAPVQATGKSYLARCLGVLSAGREPELFPHVHQRDDETRKRLFSILLSATPCFVWDNIKGDLDSAAMAAMLTSEQFNDRILGESRSATTSTRALVLLTGNNLSLAGDMPRRVLKVRLDAQMENPANRKFSGDPLSFISRHRQDLVRAGLMIIRAYLESDAHKRGGAIPGETTASFEAWDTLCRQPVAWLGQQLGDWMDPAQLMRDAVNTDPEREAWGCILENIEAVMGTDWFTAEDLIAKIDALGAEMLAHHEELRKELCNLSPSGSLSSRSVGRKLSRHHGQIVNGRRLVKQANSSRSRYRLVRDGL